ncbi:uncharacterized protein N7483_006452 [Penicillium malachiteum]|uniref:uncharacterized protein n=1 Tax=Penicillium malachiteum TaxID=1324776 RepID=UPI002547B103|nr:uncharacterized protein N7483_006452 [Penicillium malachiteum]KAJ5725095.1 hypothetical protein N7483_006452 [Penicillium malachiteum]
MAQKCSLPVREPIPGTNLVPEDVLPKEVSMERMQKLALQAFFYDYSICTVTQSMSGGFLGGLEAMVRKYLAKRIQAHYASDSEPFAIAILLGLYQIIVANASSPGHHTAHAKGAAAILQIENNPLYLIQASLTSHPLLLDGNQSCHSTTGKYSTDRQMYEFLIRLDPIWKRTEDLLAGSPFAVDSDVLLLLKIEAVKLNDDISLWQKSQNEEIKAVTIDSGPPPNLTHGVGYWPGRVDMYIDLYVATLWNVSRIVRCLLITLITRLSGILCDGVNHDADRLEVSNLVEDMLASIPYHLSEDLQVFLRERHEHTEITNPGRSVGGLLLMHPIYLAAYLDIIPSDRRLYFKKCLVWIAQRMGVGQAAFLAQAPQVDNQYFAGGCLIVLAGLLL